MAGSIFSALRRAFCLRRQGSRTAARPRGKNESREDIKISACRKADFI